MVILTAAMGLSVAGCGESAFPDGIRIMSLRWKRPLKEIEKLFPEVKREKDFVFYSKRV